MKRSFAVSALLLTSAFGYASSLSVYQDQSFYSYTANSSYIGFTQGIKAKCEGENAALSVMTSCPQDQKLCKDSLAIGETEKRLNAIQYNGQVLDTLLTLPQPTQFNADDWISAAKRIGEEKADILFAETRTKEILRVKQNAFSKKVTSKKALQTEQTCSKELELTLPRNNVSFTTSYEADIENKKEIKVTQYLSIVNRSGIEIKADDATFYYRMSSQYVRPITFNPWIVSKYVPRPKRKLMKKSISNARMAEEAVMDVSMASPAGLPRKVATYVDAREYQIKDLDLPSTGLPLDVQVTSWKSELSCELKAHPYVNTEAFTVCSFEPKQQIDSNSWKVKEGSLMLNENAVGQYSKGKYNLYTQIDEDIKILRKPIVKKERETGIFGGTVRKKDGFTLTVTNKSDKSKTLTLIDRIPTSTTDEIKVKLLELKTGKNIDYKMLKDGKVEMKLTLDAKESRKIELLFEISYDKELKIIY